MPFLPSPSSRPSLALVLSVWAGISSAGFIPINVTTTSGAAPSTPFSQPATITPAPSTPAATFGNGSYTSFPVNSSMLDWAGADKDIVASVVECQSEHVAWSSQYNSFSSSACSAGHCTEHPVYMYSSASLPDWFAPNYTGAVTTLCDGVPRATGPATNTPTVTDYSTSTEVPSFSVTQPSCTYNQRGCGLLAQAQSSKLYQSAGNLDCIWGGNDHCVLPAEASQACRIGAAEVQVFYWPTSKDNDWLCTRSSGPVTAAPKTDGPPVTAVYQGQTFTSPSIYLSFQWANAWPCLSTYYNFWMSTPPELMSSIRHRNRVWDTFTPTPGQDTTALSWALITRPVDWADLVTPVPADAYRSQSDCAYWRKDKCTTIFDDYKPDVVLPTQQSLFTHIDPKFANCSKIDWYKFVLDPPVPLTTEALLVPTEASSGAPVTTTAAADPAAETTPASPVSEGTTPFAPSTAAPATATAAKPTASADPVPVVVVGGGATANSDPKPTAGAVAGGQSQADPSGPADPADPADPQDSSSGGGSSSSSNNDPANDAGSSGSSGSAGADPAAFISEFMGFTADPAAPTAGSADSGSGSGSQQQNGDPGTGSNNGDPGANNGGGSGNNAPIPIATVGSHTIVGQPGTTAGGGAIAAVGGTQLAAGQSTTLDGGVPVVVEPSAVIVGGVTHAIPAATAADPNSGSGSNNGDAAIPIATAGTATIVRPAGAADGVVAVGGTTLSAGQTTTLDSGAQIGVQSSAVVVDGSTYAIPPAAPTTPADDRGSSSGGADAAFVGALTTIGGTPLSLDSSGGLWAGALSLTAGPTIALRVSDPGSGSRTTALVHWQSGSAVVVGSEVFPLTGSSAGVGAFILSGLGGTPKTTMRETVRATLTQTVRASSGATGSGGSGAARETGTGTGTGAASSASGAAAAASSTADDGLGGGTDAPSLATGTETAGAAAAATTSKSGAGGGAAARSLLCCVAMALMALHSVWL